MHIYVYVYMHTYVRTYVYIYIYTHIYTCIYIYTCTYNIHIYIYIYIYTCTYMYSHTYLDLPPAAPPPKGLQACVNPSLHTNVRFRAREPPHGITDGCACHCHSLLVQWSAHYTFLYCEQIFERFHLNVVRILSVLTAGEISQSQRTILNLLCQSDFWESVSQCSAHDIVTCRWWNFSKVSSQLLSPCKMTVELTFEKFYQGVGSHIVSCNRRW